MALSAQTFQNASLEVWGGSGACMVNTVPDNWLSFTNEGSNFDECDFAFCGSTIPDQAAEGTSYGRAYAGSTTSGEGIAQEVFGFLPGNEYQLSFQFAGSNLLPGFNPCQWHVFLDDVHVDQTNVFGSAEMQWDIHVFSFIATATSHVFGFRACTSGASGGSAAIDNFLIQDVTPVVPVLPVAAFVAPEQMLCVGDCFVFSNNSQFASVASWNFESGSPSTSQDTDEVEVCYNQAGTFMVELIVGNEEGVDTMQQWVTVVSIPTGSLNQLGDSLVLTTDVAIGDFNWTLDGEPLPVSGYLLTPLESGSYQVNLQNEEACSASINLLVTLPEVFVAPDPISVWIPNAVTFGADGVNDVWGVYGELSQLESIRTQVFDRWGETVFETNVSEARWTGNAFSGSYYVPDGIYLYTVLMKFQGEIEPRFYQGHITVIR